MAKANIQEITRDIGNVMRELPRGTGDLLMSTFQAQKNYLLIYQPNFVLRIHHAHFVTELLSNQIYLLAGNTITIMTSNSPWKLQNVSK